MLAALILPEDLVNKINSLSTLTPGTPKVEVLVNEADPLKASVVGDRIEALLAQANLALAKRIADEGGRYLNLVIGAATCRCSAAGSTSSACRQAPTSSKRSNRRCRTVR